MAMGALDQFASGIQLGSPVATNYIQVAHVNCDDSVRIGRIQHICIHTAIQKNAYTALVQLLSSNVHKLVGFIWA